MTDRMSPLDGQKLSADLRSDDPERVASALETLERAWPSRPAIALPMPEPDCLDAFGDVVPAEVLERYVRVLADYPGIVCPPGETVRHALVEAVLRYGRGEGTYDVAMALKLESDPDYAVTDALEHIWRRGLHDPRETQSAERLVDHLLDSDKTRRATVDLLARWAMVDRFPEIIDAVRARLDDAERARIEEAASGRGDVAGESE
jgi:hypothetical protein